MGTNALVLRCVQGQQPKLEVQTSVPSGTARGFSSPVLDLARLGGTTAILEVLVSVGAVSARPFMRLDWLPWLISDISVLFALPVLPVC